MTRKKNKVDVLEAAIPEDILEILLRDHTYRDQIKHIFWATSDYESLGQGYQYTDTIECDKIIGNNIIIPRVLKSKLQQNNRVREMAEVFTPAWICNAQNNLIDDAWFGCKGIFNIVIEENNSWKVNPDKITFPKGKTWKDYVRDNRMEITCGEAPYLVNRYDTTTGEEIPTERRIGLLDRKLRVVSENTVTSDEWLDMAQDALKSIYGFEWQGDNLLLAREAMLFTFRDFYTAKFGKQPAKTSLKYAAYIISWNLWQMDGLKGVIPGSCHIIENISLFSTVTKTPCRGCEQESFKYHNGKYCLIKDWKAKDPQTGKYGRIIRYVDLIK